MDYTELFHFIQIENSFKKKKLGFRTPTRKIPFVAATIERPVFRKKNPTVRKKEVHLCA